jgi:hypothetical protein
MHEIDDQLAQQIVAGSRRPSRSGALAAYARIVAST